MGLIAKAFAIIIGLAVIGVGVAYSSNLHNPAAMIVLVIIGLVILIGGAIKG